MFPQKQQVNATSLPAVQKLCEDIENRLFPSRIAGRERQRKETERKKQQEEKQRKIKEQKLQEERQEQETKNTDSLKTSLATSPKMSSLDKIDSEELFVSIVLGVIFVAAPWVLSLWGYTFGAEHCALHGLEDTPIYKVIIANLSFYFAILSFFWTIFYYFILDSKSEKTAFWITLVLIIAMLWISASHTPYYTPAYYIVLWGF